MQVSDVDGVDVVVDCARRRLGDVPPLDALTGPRRSRDRLGLDLTANRIWRLPPSRARTRATINGLRRLDLSSNSLRTLTGDGAIAVAFGGDLEVLVLNGNGIGHVENGAFSGLTNLRRLSLAANRLWSLDGGLMDGLPVSLQALDLSRNLVEVVPSHAFSGLENLRNLSLARNRIRFVHANAFGAPHVSNDEEECVQRKTNTSSSEERPTIQPLGTETATSNHVLGDSGWSYVPSLQNVDLSYNLLRTVPCWGSAADSLQNIILDGNPVRRLRSAAFRSLRRLRDLSLAAMPQLLLIDADVFVDLPQLRVLRLHDNRRLAFLDPRALDRDIRGRATLRQISLHNDALLAVPSLTAVDSNGRFTRWISAAGNPLHCDCNVRWLRDVILSANTMNVVDGEEVRCDSPTRLRGRRLAEVKAEDPAVVDGPCPSVVVPFFDATTVARLGDRVQLDCRAIGRPLPRLHWILPHRTVLNASSIIDAGRLAVDADGTLTVAAVRASDFGTYTCVALNARGYDAAATSLSASEPLPCQADNGRDDGRPRPRLLVKGIASTFVAVTWNGTDVPGAMGTGRSRGVRYAIVYREAEIKKNSDNSVYKQIEPDAAAAANDDDDDDDDPVYKGRIDLRPYMRAFTVNNLRPLTHYEFCLGCELEDHLATAAGIDKGKQTSVTSHRFFRSSCIRIRTTKDSGNPARFGMAENGVRVVFGMAVVITTVAVLSLCGLLVVIRRIGRQVSYHEPPGRWNAAEDCVDVRRQRRDTPAARTILIPLTNLVELSSTPISSSKTSLLHAI